MAWEHGETWFRVLGDLDPGADQVPVVLLHGGPGATARLPRAGRRPRARDRSRGGALRPAGLRELDAPAATLRPSSGPSSCSSASSSLLLDHLGISARYSLLGQSWGGMLAMEHAIDRAGRSRRHGRGRLAGEHPAVGRGGEPAARRPAARGGRRRCVATRRPARPAPPEYAEAVQVFYDRHLCRVPMPEPVVRSVRPARRGPDGLPRDERPVGVPRASAR